MQPVNRAEIERKIDYLGYALEKIETHMLKDQSERLDIKQKILYLQHLLQEQIEVVA